MLITIFIFLTPTIFIDYVTVSSRELLSRYIALFKTINPMSVISIIAYD